MKLDHSKTKQIAVIGTATILIAAAGWLLFTSPANARVAALKAKLATQRDQLGTTERKAHLVDKISGDLEELESRLMVISDRLVKGDKYLWVIRNLGKYQVPGSLEFTGFDQPVETEWGLPGTSTLKAASFLVKGLGVYQEFGKFTAALENDYPGLRFRTVTVWPSDPLADEKIAFTMEIIGIVSPQEPEKPPTREDLMARQ